MHTLQAHKKTREMKTSPLITKEAMGNELISRNFGKRDEKMKLQTVTYSESNELFAVFKQYMMPTIDGAIGWDEDFQFDGFVENLKRDWFRWLIVRNEKAGLVCFRTIESRTHIHLLIVFHPFQRQGLARQFFRLIKSKHKSKCLSLSSLKNNKIAIYMYTKYGFKVIAEDEHFYSFIKFNTNREVP